MKRFIHVKVLIIFSFLFFFVSQNSFGQASNPHPEGEPAFYSWFQQAWRVNADYQSLEDWDKNPQPWTTNGMWEKWNGSNWIPQTCNLNQICYPPTGGNVNKLFVEITAGTNLDVASLNYKNLTYIWVCGKLTIGDFVLVPPPVFEPVISLFQDSSSFEFEACFETGEQISQIGFYFAPDGYTLDDLFEGNWFRLDIEDLTKLECHEIEGVEGFNRCCFSETVDVNLIVDYFPDALLTDVFQFVAFAEATLVGVTAEGISSIGFFALNSSKSNGLEVTSINKNTDDGSALFNFNNFHLKICEGGEFNVKTLTAGNGANIEINGTFNIETLNVGNNGDIIIGPTGILNVGTINMGLLGDIWLEGGQINFTGTTGGITMDNLYCVHIAPGSTINGLDPYTESGWLEFFDVSGNPSSSDCVLPIELMSFYSTIKPDRIEISWTTGTEINNDFFSIERSRDLYGWEVLGFVDGAGNSSTPISYSFADIRPLDGLAYYRLKQTDFDGKFEYFGPIAANYDFGLNGLEFKVMKQFSNWIIAVPNDGVYHVEVYNLQGHRLASEKIENNLVIPAPQGAVVIRVTDGFARSASRVVM